MEFPDDILSHYFAQKHGRQLVHHQIDSFNYFTKYETQKIINSFNPCVIEKELPDKKVRHTITFKNPCYCPPIMLKQNGNTTELYPYQARIQNLTYASTLIVDIDQLVEHFDTQGNKLSEERISSENAIIGSIPIMLYSNLCQLTKYNGNIEDLKESPYDKGGYFIINGVEKVIISQEKMADNKMYFFEKKNSKISHVVKIRSVHPENGLVCEITLLYHKTGEIKIKLPHFKRDDLPIGIVMKMLGISSEKEFQEIISQDDYAHEITSCIVDTREHEKESSSIAEIITKFSSNNNRAFMKDEYMNNYIQNYILPHMSYNQNTKTKASYLGYATKLLLDFVHGKIEETDRDQYSNKRIETPGFLMGQLLRKLYSKLIVDIRQAVQKDISSHNYNVNVKRIIKSSGIENGFKFSLATGNWNLGTTKNTISQYSLKVGVAQVLNRLNYSAMLSHLRRINTPIDKKGKLVKPRKLNGTSIFTTCPAETPEGQSVGIVKNLSLSTSMSTESNDEAIINLLLKKFKIEPLEDISYTLNAKVFVNGKWIGQTNNPIEIMEELKDMKRKCLIHFETSISFHFDLEELRIYTDGGRCYHPLFVVGKNNELLWKGQEVSEFREYIRQGWIEYLDIEEMENAMIAMNVSDLQDTTKRYTHCEIHPGLMMGVCASIIPFSNHNQAPRVAYQSSMGKQAIGHYISNMDDRMDSMCHILMNPQKPLVSSKIGKYLHSDVLASGENIIVAYCCYSGQNQEDSVILNQSAIERGLFKSFFYRTYKDEEKSSATPNAEERFCNPSQIKGCKGLKYGSYDHIDSTGIVKKGMPVKGNDILIGKITPISSHTTRQVRDMNYRDNSTTVRHKEDGVVDKVIVTQNNEGHRLVKIRLRQDRTPVIGDKFACYDNQTQVLTNNGWKYFKNVNKEDKICSLVDGIIQYMNPTNYFEYQVENQDMIYLENKHVNFCVTPNHMMYIKTRYGNFQHMRADQMFNRMVQFQNNGINNNEDIEYFEIEGHKYKMDDWLKFVGMYISDGSCTQIEKRRLRYIQLACTKYRKLKFISQFLDNMKIHYILDQQGPRISCQGKFHHLFTEIKQYGQRAHLKHLPEYVWKLSQKQSRILLDALIEGDGTRGDGTWRYYTVSKQLCDDVQRLALHCGWSANIKLKTPEDTPYCINTGRRISEGTSNYDYFQITIIKSHNRPWFNKKKNPSNIKKIIKYTGKVYCVEVPPSHTIYVRRGPSKNANWCGQSRISQKGIVGMVFREEDMPITESGIVPDLIINSHALPSRMTVGMLMETLIGKVGCMEAELQDATPFQPVDMENMMERLEEHGYQRMGNETMYNGMTGEQMKSQVFIGPVYYQRLKHMVADKSHCLDYQHDILTEDGWKNHKTLTMDDKIATLKDGKLVYEKPLNIFDYPDYQGKMYKVNHPSVNLHVTDNHRMWVSGSSNNDYQFEYAKDIQGKRKYKKNCIWEQQDYDVDDKVLKQGLKNISEFPEWVWKLSTRQSRILVEALATKHKKFKYITKHEQVADEFMRLCLHSGWSSKKTFKSKEWHLLVNTNSAHNNPVVKECHTTMVDYQGGVYCVEVSSGVFYTRRNGKACWTGNSRAKGSVQLLVRQPNEGRSAQGGLRIGEINFCLSQMIKIWLVTNITNVATLSNCEEILSNI